MSDPGSTSLGDLMTSIARNAETEYRAANADIGMLLCSATTGHGSLCAEDSTHCVRGGGFHQWSCRQHLARVADMVQSINGESSIVIAAISWQKGR